MNSESCRKPNVVFVITDDQGYGDLGCTGNPWIHTPHIDAFHDASVRLTDFHVSPLCTPSRAAIMTGRYPLRNGAWATCWGRSLLRKNELTIADVFSSNGYKTGLFGKWHLGDNYPYRPHDRGFQTAVYHRGGGVGQTPDAWGNNYFDDTYYHNGESVSHEGYCTDVWFDEALSFIEENRDHPFFCYISTNAPHSPYLVDGRYATPYRGNEAIPEPDFYGMIANIDENFGRLRQRLRDLCLEENTILVFMTDNGSSGGCTLVNGQHVATGYNAGMRGKKGSYYDGGHRVPFFIRWPQGGIAGPRDIDELTAHIDIFPTLSGLCGLRKPRSGELDGLSVAQHLRGESTPLPDRQIFVQYRQNTEPPDKWMNAVLTRRWRLVDGTELYDVHEDPGQTQDVAAQCPETVAALRAAHEDWWEQVAPSLGEYCPISLGNDKENPTSLCAMDVMGDVAWHQTHIVLAQRSTGRWTVDVERKGRYQVLLRRWPEELDLPIAAAVTPEDAKSHIYADETGTCRTIQPTQAYIEIFGKRYEAAVGIGDRGVLFDVRLGRTGITTLDAWFLGEDGERWGAYYVYVYRVPENSRQRAGRFVAGAASCLGLIPAGAALIPLSFGAAAFLGVVNEICVGSALFFLARNTRTMFAEHCCPQSRGPRSSHARLFEMAIAALPVVSRLALLGSNCR